MEVRPGYKQTDVGVIPKDWEVKQLGEISTAVRGGSPRPAGDPRYFNGSFIPWLTVAALTNIPDSQIHVRETVGYLTEEGSQHSRTLEKNTLIIANSGATLGVAKILSIRCCANDGIAALLNQRDCDNLFLAYYLNSQTKRLREVVATGLGQPNLNTGLIGSLSIPIPPLHEQRAIAAVLSDVDALVTALDRLIAKKRAIKQGAMQQLLTGKTRLPGFSGAWEVKKLVEFGSFKKGRNLPKNQLSAEGEPCVLYGEIYTKYDCVVKELTSFIPREVAEQSTPIEFGDILFAGSGETAEEIGKCFAYIGTERAYAGGDLIIFSPTEAASIFLGYQLNSPLICEQKTRLGQGSSVVHIYASGLATIEIPFPSLPEQRAIAAVLSDMDTEIAALEAQRDKTRALKQGMMQELLTGRTRLV